MTTHPGFEQMAIRPSWWKYLLLAVILASLSSWGLWGTAAGRPVRPPDIARSAAIAARHPVRIRTPLGPPVVDSGLRDGSGEVIHVACQTCHSTRAANAANRTTEDLDQFHQGLKLDHGNRACVACHNPADGYKTLRLADGQAVEFSDVMTLCAQCHGPQYRDYQHGSHGGMNGYWDLTRGPRERNNCVDCHDPHAPQFPRVRPAPLPRDRFWHPSAPQEPHHD